MELILIKDVSDVGLKGELVRVRSGFARNFLLPRKLAIPSTHANQQFVEIQKTRAAQRRVKEQAEAENRAADLAAVKLTIQAPAGEQNKLFGSVTAEAICQALAREGHVFDKKRIHLKEPIRTLGSHTVAVELYPQVKAQVTIEVVRQS